MTSSAYFPRFQESAARDASGRRYDPALRSGSDSLAIETLHSVLACVRHLTEPLARAAETADISLSRSAVLLRLWKTPGQAAPMHEIAAWCNVTPRNITGLIDGLETAGLVARHHNPADRRVTMAGLTASGLERIESYAPRHGAIVERCFSALSPDEQHTLIDMCVRLAAAAFREHTE